MSRYSLEEGDGVHSPPCECCGTSTRRIWGHLYREGDVHAVYYVRWTLAHLDRGARFDLVFGEWGDHTSPANRFVVAVECDLLDPKYSLMVIDADPDRLTKVAARHLRREQVIGTPLAQTVFDALDFIWIHDPRVADLRSHSR